MSRFAVACMLLSLALAARAESRFVTDKLSTELRRGPGTEYLIVRMLEAGEAVDVLEQDKSSGFSRVRVQDQGTEGWMLTRFLSAEASARDRLAAAESGAAKAAETAQALEERVAALTAELAAARAELDETHASHAEASRELADIKTAAANVIEIRDENASLRQRLLERDRQVEALTAENRTLSGRTNQNWFLIGAGVLFGGILIGLIAPSLRRKRRSSW